MLESRLVSESITHHPNKMSQLGDSVWIAPTIGKGTSRTCEVNGAQYRTTEPMMLSNWCTVQQETSSYGSLSCIGLCDLSGLATSRPIPSHWRSLYTGFSLMTITNMRDGNQFTSVIGWLCLLCIPTCKQDSRRDTSQSIRRLICFQTWQSIKHMTNIMLLWMMMVGLLT